MVNTEKVGNTLGLIGIIAFPLLAGFVAYESYKQSKPVPLAVYRKVEWKPVNTGG
ncbi:MAG: hypothetical protein KJ820_16320 [Bacteroidetes bacterium]|nr:hypothetical protein [Bacteroidota bacterium]